MYPYHPTDFSFYPSLYLLYHYPLLFLDTRLPLLPNLSSLSSSLFSLYTSPCKQPRLTPTPFSILSFSFLLHPIVQSLFLSLSDSTKLSILSGATFNPPPPRPPPFFSSLHRPIHRVSTCSTLSYRSPSEHTYPHLDHPESPTNGRRQQRERPRAFSQSRYILLSVFFFFFWGPFLGTSIFDVYVFSSVVVSLWRDRQDHFRPHFFPIGRTSSEVLVFARTFLDSVFLVFRRYSQERGQDSNFSRWQRT